MLDYFYHRNLKPDLERWVEKGWVSSESAANILREIEGGDGRSRLPLALAGIGVVCVALALAAFIAANWDGIPRNAKLIGIVLLVAGSHGVAALCASKGKKGLADLATAFASLTFIGGMALVGQIFHLSANLSGGAFLVTIGALAAAWLTGSRASLMIGAIAAIIWQWERPEFGAGLLQANIIGFAFFAATALHAARYSNMLTRWLVVALLMVSVGRLIVDYAPKEGVHRDLEEFMVITGFACLAAIMVQVPAIIDMAIKWASSYPKRHLGHWMLMSSFQDAGILILCALTPFLLIVLGDGNEMPFIQNFSTIPQFVLLALALASSVIGAVLSFKTGKALTLFGVIFLALLAAFMPLVIDSMIVLSALALAASIAIVVLGTLYRRHLWSLGGYAALSVISLWLLYETIGSLLGQALFFLIAGLLLLVLAFAAMKLLKHFSPAKTPASGKEAAQ